MIVLVVGSTGAGKTTYARKLAQDLPGVVYSIDNWMKSMFGADMPEDPQPEWFYENQQWYVQRIARCEKMITDLATQRAKMGQQSILDLGFSTEEHRKLFIDHFKDLDIPVSIHYLDVDVDERKRRVRNRNAVKGDTYVMTVDDSLFGYMEEIFESPTTSEGVEVHWVGE